MGDIGAFYNGTFNDSFSNLTMNETRALPCGSYTYTIRRAYAPLRLSYQAISLTLAVIGNICVIIFIKRWKVTSSRMYLFIIHLCVADLCVAVFNILPHLVEFATSTDYVHDVWCKLVMYMKMVSLYMSAYIMIATAVDRYREVFHPKSQSIKTNYVLLSIGWTVPFIFSVPQLINFEMVGNRCRMTAQKNYFQAFLLFFTISMYIVPLLLLIFIYGRLSLVTWKKDKWQQHMDINGVKYSIQTTRSRNLTADLSDSKKKTIQLTFVVVLFYFICWTPFVIAHFWSTYGSPPRCSKYAYLLCLFLNIEDQSQTLFLLILCPVNRRHSYTDPHVESM